jgi:hypothetical protein
MDPPVLEVHTAEAQGKQLTEAQSAERREQHSNSARGTSRPLIWPWRHIMGGRVKRPRIRSHAFRFGFA